MEELEELRQAVGRHLDVLHDSLAHRPSPAAGHAVGEVVPSLEKQLAQAQTRLDVQGEHRLLKEEVGVEEVAEVVGMWTGIPVAKMLETENQKLLQMEVRLGARVVGQDEAVAAVA